MNGQTARTATHLLVLVALMASCKPTLPPVTRAAPPPDPSWAVDSFVGVVTCDSLVGHVWARQLPPAGRDTVLLHAWGI